MGRAVLSRKAREGTNANSNQSGISIERHTKRGTMQSALAFNVSAREAVADALGSGRRGGTQLGRVPPGSQRWPETVRVGAPPVGVGVRGQCRRDGTGVPVVPLGVG